MIIDNFSNNVSRLRKEAQMSQGELAEKMNVSISAVSKWENGKNFPNIETIKAIAAFFDVPMETLLNTYIDEPICSYTKEISFLSDILDTDISDSLCTDPNDTESCELIAFAESTEPIKAIESVETIESIEAIESVEITNPAEPIESIEITEPEETASTEASDIHMQIQKNTSKSFVRIITISSIILCLCVAGFFAAAKLNTDTKQPVVVNTQLVEDAIWGATTELAVYYHEEITDDMAHEYASIIREEWMHKDMYGGKSVNTLKVIFYTNKSDARNFSEESDYYLMLFSNQ